MAAFPELGYGYKSNRQTIVDPPASYEAVKWMKNMDCGTFIAMMREHHKNWDKLSRFTQCCIARNFADNPERMFIEYGERFSS